MGALFAITVLAVGGIGWLLWWLIEGRYQNEDVAAVEAWEQTKRDLAPGRLQ